MSEFAQLALAGRDLLSEQAKSRAVNALRFWQATGCTGLSCMSIGAAEEAHKNLEGLIIAFALLPENVQAVTQLAIVSELSEDMRRRLTAVAKEHHLKEDQLVCPGYVPEEDLRLLYASCSAFVSPSLHERVWAARS